MTGGAVGGPWGAAIGTGLGGLMGFFGQDKPKKLDNWNKEQKALFSQMMQMLGPEGGLGQGMQSGIDLQRQLMDPSSEAVRQFSDPYIREFEQQTVPGIAERFAGMGGMGGGLSSSGFGQTLSSAGSNLQSQLAQLKAGLGQNAAQSLMNQYGSMAGGAMSAQPFSYMRPQESGGAGMMQAWGQAGMPGIKGASDYLSKWWSPGAGGG
jgi:hypothetical protein